MGLFGGLFAGLIDDSEWCYRVRTHLNYSQLSLLRERYNRESNFPFAESQDMVYTSVNTMDEIEYLFKPMLKDFNKLPRPRSNEANAIRKHLLVGIEAHMWSANDGSKWVTEHIRKGKGSKSYLKEHVKWGLEGHRRLGQALEYIEAY